MTPSHLSSTPEACEPVDYWPIRAPATKTKGEAKKLPAIITVAAIRVCSRWSFCRAVMTGSSVLVTIDMGAPSVSGSDEDHYSVFSCFRRPERFLTALASLTVASCKAERCASSIGFICAKASPAASMISARRK